MEPEQNNMQPTPAPMQENAFPSAGEKMETSNYALIGGLIGIAIIALGAWYVMKGNGAGDVVPAAPVAPEIVVTPPTATETTPAETAPEADTAAMQMKIQGTSDELGSIEADLNATDLGTLDDIKQI